MSESSTGTWEDDPVTLLGLGVLDGTVDSDALNGMKSLIDQQRRNPGWLDRHPQHRELKRHRHLGNLQGWG